ncbi:MAG TPA: hypothetical protein DD417_11120 [Elusimicrobia bacterium]|nr:hypothetical protein [Elusimicrobiota bacterium]
MSGQQPLSIQQPTSAAKGFMARGSPSGTAARRRSAVPRDPLRCRRPPPVGRPRGS